MAAEREESDEITGDIGDAAKNVTQIAESLRGIPPSDWVTESPVSTNSGPEITGMPVPGVASPIEAAIVPLAIIGRIIWMAIAAEVKTVDPWILE
jgi:hypothetical protein